ncbi:metal-dependent hydrolase [Metabacillus idriensis]|uniref:Metal-dependent hydrolase n=1 Tax=Metabacillus idriensis TaxID=324768 RepID=A0A6I2MEK3_9BACI|nr:metal-dependent hydrolase [Metabacillus idriensis]MCM3596875.1 metal-dependent hydrolase [Metabacillus idriensis]MRX55774.1 metal-dependent hydrolase [Metabacillus idriensis]
MNGTSHMAIGAGTGFIIANTAGADFQTTLLLSGLGGLTALMPDFDIDGKLSNKITFSHQFFRTVAQIVGFLMIMYSFFQGRGNEIWIGMGTGTGIIVLSAFIRQRHMLTMTGIGVAAGGFSLQEIWIFLLGAFIVAASFVPHRSYTHSLAGLAFFAVIAFQFEQATGVNHSFIVSTAGYASHLIADMKILPFNRRGVKYFLPISSKEF